MNKLFNPMKIRNLEVKNRIAVPPMVIYNRTDDTGYVTDIQIEHYRKIAQGGPGLIIQEATCVEKAGRLCDSQIGIWEDGQIEGLSRITKAVHETGTPIFVQIHHGGIYGFMEETVCPSEIECMVRGKSKKSRALSLDELHRIQNSFAEAAERAYKAGYDGIELHGCHNYLISQFLNSRVNVRNDEYGKNLALFAKEIIREIRKRTPASFIVGMRLGAYEPTLSDSIDHALEFQACGIDFLNISSGFAQLSDPFKPDDYPFTDLIYGAQEIRKRISVPVFTVGEITSPKQADEILNTARVDMVNIGRGTLVNPNWASDAINGKDTGACIHCKTCMWRIEPQKCPGRIKYERKNS
ncbi:NADH:flavin oxidoreductase [Lacrimispora sp.]|jgi:2,4-dienoyl-CoA reductase-like NADH-dependent reductase (Old Yellow Enzyme family)|uniref:NADH:flavin oxidoreductase n=1 Tax=Lacrimispora sp. TaxID=2719234 RepID=UPI0029E37639|nr:dehydrogenase [Lacrimispora sp.]